MSDSARQRRRRRLPIAQVVAIRGRTFADDWDGDSIPSIFSEPGRDPTVASEAAPAPFYVHRFRDELPPLVAFDLDLPSLSTALDLALVRRRVAWGARRSAVRAAKRKRIAASWREFNVLRADPRQSFCVRRAVRRNVLFARGVAGRRGLGRHGVRRSVSSAWRC